MEIDKRGVALSYCFVRVAVLLRLWCCIVVSVF